MGKRPIHKLTDAECRAFQKPGLYGDGGGLYLRVAAGGSRQWIFRSRRKDWGFGAYPKVTLKEARDLADKARKLLDEGEDPGAARRAKPTAAPETMTFARATEKYIETHRAGWKHPAHLQQWQNSLRNYAEPVIGHMDVAAIEQAHVLAVLEPVWATKMETAQRLRARIENILDWAIAKKYRTAENPAQWKGGHGLEHSLPAALKIERNFPALAYEKMPEFMRDLLDRTDIAAAPLRLTILTASRPRESIGARWNEFDLDAGLWTIAGFDPSTDRRMKGNRAHVVPLSQQALTILRQMEHFRQNDYVFPGARRNRPISNRTMLTLLDRMGYGAVTVHGFRAAFKSWASDVTDFDRMAIEMSLSHRIGKKEEEAYLRTKLLPKRRLLMQAWADYCYGARKPEPVIAGPVSAPQPVVVVINGESIEVSPTDPALQRWLASLGVGRAASGRRR